MGLLAFTFEDEDGKALLTWEFAEKGVMWGMLFLFAGGLALGSLVTETGAALKMAEAITLLPLTGGLETVFAFTLFSTVLTEISSNTAAAAIAVPVVQSIAQALGLNPIPYLFVAIVAFNSAYVLPVSIRAIPVSYGLDPAELFKNGLLLSLCSVLLITVVGYLFIRYWRYSRRSEKGLSLPLLHGGGIFLCGRWRHKVWESMSRKKRLPKTSIYLILQFKDCQ